VPERGLQSAATSDVSVSRTKTPPRRSAADIAAD